MNEMDKVFRELGQLYDFRRALADFRLRGTNGEATRSMQVSFKSKRTKDNQLFLKRRLHEG